MYAVRKVTARFPFPIQVIVNRPSLGQIASIDKAYATVTTPYIFHCEDDWRFFRSGFIESSLALLQLDRSISVVCSRRLENLRNNSSCVLDAPVVMIGGVAHRKADPWRIAFGMGTTSIRACGECRIIGCLDRSSGGATKATPACSLSERGWRLPTWRLRLAKPQVPSVGCQNNSPFATRGRACRGYGPTGVFDLTAKAKDTWEIGGKAGLVLRES